MLTVGILLALLLAQFGCNTSPKGYHPPLGSCSIVASLIPDEAEAMPCIILTLYERGGEVRNKTFGDRWLKIWSDRTWTLEQWLTEGNECSDPSPPCTGIVASGDIDKEGALKSLPEALFANTQRYFGWQYIPNVSLRINRKKVALKEMIKSGS